MVYNPLYPWTKEALQAMIDSGKKYFVRQLYQRGKIDAPESVTHVFWISHYDDIAVANHHLQNIRQIDHSAVLYDINKDADKEKLFKTTDHYSQYLFYSNALYPNWKDRWKKYERQLRTHIETQLNWHPAGKDKVLVGLHSEYGQLWVSFKYKSQKARYLLDDIEKLPRCVMILPYLLQSS